MFELAWSKLLEFWGGFLTHASALLPPTNSIAAGISFALIAAVILVPIMSRVGLGTMIGYLLAGIVVGPYGLGLVEEVETIMNFAEFGIVLMMFLIGLELDPKRLWEMKLPVFAGGPLQMILCALPFALLLDLGNAVAGRRAVRLRARDELHRGGGAGALIPQHDGAARGAEGFFDSPLSGSRLDPADCRDSGARAHDGEFGFKRRGKPRRG